MAACSARVTRNMSWLCRNQENGSLQCNGYMKPELVVYESEGIRRMCLR